MSKTLTYTLVLDAEPIGNVIADMQAVLGVGYTLTFADNPGALYAIVNSSQIAIDGVLSVGTSTITVHADDEVHPTVIFVITIKVINVAPSWSPGKRPFSLTSPANLPLVTGTNYMQVNWPVATGFNYTTGVKFYFDIPASTETNTITWTAPGSWGNPTQVIHRIMTPGFAGVTQITGISDGDNEAVSFSHSGTINIYNFNVSGNAGSSGAYAFDDIVSGTGFGNNAGLPTGGTGAGIVAAGSNLMMGCLIKEEFTETGEFNHWIAFSMLTLLCNNQTPNFYPPAIAGDGFSGDGLFCEGQLLAIPLTTSMPGSLSTYGQAMFRAMQNYGAWCMDTSGAITPYCARWYKNIGVSPWSESSSWTDTDIGLLRADCNILFPLLYKTGYLLDGYLFTSAVISTWNPQVQLVRYLGALLQVTRDSDSASASIGSVGPPSGNLDTTGLANFCSGTIGRMTTYFDQIGNGRHVISIGAAAPIMYQSGAVVTLNGNPAMLFDGTSNFLKIPTSANSFGYLNIGFQLDDLTSDHTLFGSDATGGLVLYVEATTGFVKLKTNTGTPLGASPVAITAGTPWVIEMTINVGSSNWSMSLNGVKVAAGSLGVFTSGNVLIGSTTAAGASLFKGTIGSVSLHGFPSGNCQFTLGRYLAAFWGATAHNFILAKDTFTDTNGTALTVHTMDIGTGWSADIGAFSIQSNQAVASTNVGGVALEVFAAAADGHYQMKMAPIGGFGAGNTDFPGMVFRHSDDSNYYLLQIEASNNRLAFYRVQGGGRANLGFFIGAFGSGSLRQLNVFLQGPSISVVLDATQVFSISNTFNVNASNAGMRSEKAGSPANAMFEDMQFNSL